MVGMQAGSTTLALAEGAALALEREVAGIIEVAPAGTLVGLAKRAMRGVPGTSINTPEDLASLKG